MEAVAENFTGLRRVVENAFTVAPTGGGQQQGHGEVFLPVRGGSLRVMFALKVRGPGEVTGINAVRVIHIAHGEGPESVKKVLPVHLHAHHHAVAHALCTGINIAGIHHAAAVRIQVLVDFFIGIEE